MAINLSSSKPSSSVPGGQKQRGLPVVPSGGLGLKRKCPAFFVSDSEEDEGSSCSDADDELATPRYHMKPPHILNTHINFILRLPYAILNHSRRLGFWNDRQNKRQCVLDPFLVAYLQLFGEPHKETIGSLRVLIWKLV